MLYLRDLGIIMPPSVLQKTTFTAHPEQNWNAMEHDNAATLRITQATEALRTDVCNLLVSLQ